MDGASQDVAQFEFIDAPHLLPVYYRPTHDTDDATAVDAQASIPATLPMVPRRAWFFDASIPFDASAGPVPTPDACISTRGPNPPF
jgi:hypothetical protein